MVAPFLFKSNPLTASILLWLSTLMIMSVHGMQEKSSLLAFYIIGGVAGGGSKPEYVKELFNDEKLAPTLVPSPSYYNWPLWQPWKADLGQEHCLESLRKTLSEHEGKVLIHAFSQGAATALNYLAEEDKGERIAALILEGGFASGNSAISYAMRNNKKVTGLPFSYYWLAYAANYVFPFYCPAGKQPIKSVAHVPAHVPIILIHCKEDAQVSYSDACALYYGLRARGNKNVYFISREAVVPVDHEEALVRNHTNLLQDASGVIGDHYKKIITAILHQHQIRENKSNDMPIDVTPYQPDHQQFKSLYENLLAQERRMKHVAITVRGAFALSVLAILYKLSHGFSISA